MEHNWKKTLTPESPEGIPQDLPKVLQLYHERPCQNLMIQTDHIPKQLNTYHTREHFLLTLYPLQLQFLKRTLPRCLQTCSIRIHYPCSDLLTFGSYVAFVFVYTWFVVLRTRQLIHPWISGPVSTSSPAMTCAFVYPLMTHVCKVGPYSLYMKLKPLHNGLMNG